jgi:hypothetical protein
MDYFVDLDGNIQDRNISSSLEELRKIASSVTIPETPEVPWFPKTLEDFKHSCVRILSNGDGI